LKASEKPVREHYDMPWVRIDENAMDHPKFLALSDGAWRLWCEGQAYCQKHLTNGHIPTAALKGFRYYSLARLKNLLAEHVPGKGPCWHDGAAGGYVVHDYLDWNDSRAEVQQARSDARERKRRFRDRHALQNGERTPNVSSGVVCSGNGSVGKSTREPVNLMADPVLTERAGRFLERYAELHQKFRHGAVYLGKMHHDFQEALQLVRAFDDERLDKLATVFLNADDEFSSNGTRSLAKFRSRASWADERLRERGL
jgi:hypothetical protein